MDIETELGTIFSQRSSGPFLFLGSGFSRRYIGLENWEDLLAKFCLNKKPYAFYRGSADNNIPLAAKLIAEDFHNLWWEAPEYEQSRVDHAASVKNKTSALRFEICKYLKEKVKDHHLDDNIKHEVEILRTCDVDGIITTNWDQFIEEIFPDYKVYTGQQELLFSNTLNIAEIYKIHGSCSNPNSLILTNDDYADYNNRNAYLASKLITIFVEHPVVFIGYSITDNNVRELLKSISLCIGKENLEKLRDNLIFIDRNEPDSGPTTETSYLQFDSVQIPVKVVKTRDFSPVYSAISQFERRLPARVLRFCKEQVYEIVKTQEPDKKIAVINYEDINNSNDVEIVFGIGVLNKLGEKGYSAINSENIYEDFVFDEEKYNPQQLIEITIPNLPKNTKFIPIFKYLRKIGITSLNDYHEKGLELDKFVKRELQEFTNGSAAAFAKHAHLPYKEFLNQATESEIFSLSPLFTNIDLVVLHQFLKDNFHKYINDRYKYQFRKLITFYDWKKYGIK